MNNEFDFQPNVPNPYQEFNPAEKKKKNGYAIASLVLGIVSLVSCCCCCGEALGLILMGVSAVLAIVFAFLSKKDNNGKMDGKAIAGLVLGIIAVVILICLLVAIVGTYTLFDSMTESEMIAFFDENLKPIFEGDEEAYNKLIEMIKAVYAERAK